MANKEENSSNLCALASKLGYWQFWIGTLESLLVDLERIDPTMMLEGKPMLFTEHQCRVTLAVVVVETHLLCTDTTTILWLLRCCCCCQTHSLYFQARKKLLFS